MSPIPQTQTQILVLGSYEIIVLVVLLTGPDSIEMFNPATSSSCILPKFPTYKEGHTQDGPLACGGDYSYTNNTCLRWNSTTGSWSVSHRLKEPRQNHVSWTPPNGQGTYLLGGGYSPETVSLIKSDGSEEDVFKLKHDTRYKKCFLSSSFSAIYKLTFKGCLWDTHK